MRFTIRAVQFRRAGALLLLLLVLLPAPAQAWGFEAHKLITEQMIALLPTELKPLFERRKAFVIERSVDPDLWRTVGWEAEPPNHFLDLDFFGAYPFSELPREYDRAIEKYGRAVIHDQGLLPWRTQEFYGHLRRAFEGLTRQPPASYASDDILLFSAVLSHYVADGHVPLHSVVNYDGQRTGQSGLHSRWETQLFERNRTRLVVAPAAPGPIGSPRDFMFETLLGSNRLVDGVLSADQKATLGREFYDDGYFEVFGLEQMPVLQRRLNDSITAVTAIILGAWNEAGRPLVPVELPVKPRPIPRPRG